MRVLVCGGRFYRGYQQVFDTLNELNARRPINPQSGSGPRGGWITQIIHGDGGNTDLCADVWAVLNGYDPERYPAKWKRDDGSMDYGAGPVRNALMLSLGKPQLVLAFPGGRGTRNMIYLARAAADHGEGVTVREIS